jgi:glycosyltransferase involved in cell wall biosynthesis
VLFVISRLDGTGGAGRSVAELIPRLRNVGVRAEAVCFRRSGEGLEDDLEGAGIPVHVLEADHLPTAIWRLRRLLRERRPDVLHTTLYTADQAGRLAAWRTHTLVVSSIVNPTRDPVLLHEDDCPRWRRRLLWLLDAWTARHLTARLHAITHAVKDSAVRGLRVRPDRVVVVHRSREPGRLGQPGATRRLRARRALGLGNARIVLNVGRQAPQKGQVHLIDAFAEMASTHPDAVLLVAGAPGPSTRALEARIRERGMSDRIRLLGHREDVADLLASADVFAFPSLYEGLGGAVLEAMALGTPVVASDLPAVREITGDGEAALLVPAGDPKALAAALARVLDEPDLAATLDARGRSRYIECFTPEVEVAAMVELYRNAVADQRLGY